jgi:hypothetical protein
MLRKILFFAVAPILLTLALSSKAHAWGAYHVGYTHWGPYTGLHHYGYSYAGYGGLGYRYPYYYGGYRYGGYYGGARYGYYRRW